MPLAFPPIGHDHALLHVHKIRKNLVRFLIMLDIGERQIFVPCAPNNLIERP